MFYLNLSYFFFNSLFFILFSGEVTLSSYIFYDDASADNTSNYGNSLPYEGSANMTMSITYNSTDNCYRVMSSERSLCLLIIPSLTGLSNIEVSAEINAKHTQDFGLGFQQSANTGTSVSINSDGKTYSHNYANKSYSNGNGSKVLNSDSWFKVVLTKISSRITYEIYTMSDTLLATWEFNISDDVNYYGILHYPSNVSSGYGLIRNIQARAV